MKWGLIVVKVIVRLVVVLCAAGTTFGQVAAAALQIETDEYTRYELLSPESASFAIRYEVTATTAGAKYYFNPIRNGSVASRESVTDLRTGQPLRFEVVSGEQAVKDPLMKGADASENYIKVTLARPVPPEGQARLLILKTYKDAKSYYREGDLIVFNRPLGIPRKSVVLPAGYELVGCNVPSQVLAEPDRRIAISFMNGSGAEAPLIVKGKLGAQTGSAAVLRTSSTAKSWESPFEGATEQERLSLPSAARNACFGAVTAKTTSAPFPFTLLNFGTAPLTINNISIGGANGSRFNQSNNCGSTLAVGASCTVNVTFTPQKAGTAYSATLQISDNAPGSPQTATLTGTGQ